MFDVTYNFVYNGYVTQDPNAPLDSSRAWILTNRVVNYDGAIVLPTDVRLRANSCHNSDRNSVEPPSRNSPLLVWFSSVVKSFPLTPFRLPFSSSASGNVFTACGSFAYESGGCGSSNPSIPQNITS